MSATATAMHSSRKFVPAPVNSAARTLPRIAVIDDDPMFGKIMEQIGKKVGVEIKHFEDFEDFEDFETLDGFDVAIVDYQLEHMTGLDVGRHVERFIGSLPVILVSRTNLPKSRDWPRSIKTFVYKGMGAYAILDAALETHGITTIARNILSGRRLVNGKTRPN